MTWSIEHIEKLAQEGKIKGYNFTGKRNSTKNSKYRSQKTEMAGIRFDSKKEACRFSELMQFQQMGAVHFINVQVRFKLSVCEYIADFVYLCDGEVVVEDVKSTHTRKLPVYRLKKKLMENELGIIIKEI